jgi:hypothetical protein
MISIHPINLFCRLNGPLCACVGNFNAYDPNESNPMLFILCHQKQVACGQVDTSVQADCWAATTLLLHNCKRQPRACEQSPSSCILTSTESKRLLLFWSDQRLSRLKLVVERTQISIDSLAQDIVYHWLQRAARGNRNSNKVTKFTITILCYCFCVTSKVDRQWDRCIRVVKSCLKLWNWFLCHWRRSRKV